MYTNVSDKFKTALNGTEPAYCCKLIFGSETVNDLFSVSYSGGSCSAGIVPGGTVIANAKVELSALPATVKKGSTCTLYFGVNGEYVPQGVFMAKKIEKSSGRLTVTLEDNIAKTEKGYFSSLTYPSTTLKMLSEIAEKCGVTFDTSGLAAVTIKDKPEGYTCREIIGYIAGLYGKFAVCDRTGKIIFKWFDTTVQLSENCFDTPTVATDDSTVGRVVCGDFTAGTGTAITYDCLFMTQNQLNTVQKSLSDFKYRTGEIPLRLGNMLIDAWDIVSVTYDGETVNIPAANISMTYNGGLSMTIEAPATEQSADSGESYKSPAQKQAERITADIVSAKQALLEKADITELNAQIANLENVYAAKADITELNAQIATIDNLTAKKADVEQLYAKKADIDTLLADTATLKSLKSNVANIDVLLSGKAGTGELTSIKLTAENAEIATALIKDLTAANFRSKTIETDDFTIKSSSGKLQIVNNTIQIKDKNNTVRVQIGEDGKSDYGIYVIDASGNIMFTSYDGLHEDGIKSGIIKNDMVADDAHISGSKLDISSIIDGINADNSTYLNTSKIVIDGTKQTINAKFTELTTSISGIGTRTSALESDLSGFRTTVSETYATKSAVDNIQIGGRNIVTGTADVVIGYGGYSKGRWRKYGSAGTIQTVDITNTPISCVSKGIRLTSTDESGQATLGQDNIPLDKDSLYTLSCWIRSNLAVGVPCRLQPFYKSTTDHSGNTQDIIISDEWQYISFTAKFSPQSTGTYSGARIYLQPTAAGNYIEVCGIKLEKGNKPTDWSPAPEDTEADITALSSKQSTLEQTVNGFKTTVESTYATKSSLTGYPTLTQMNSAIDQKADSVTTTVTEQIAGITVGGRNIARGTANMTPGANNTGSWNYGTWRVNINQNGQLSIVTVTDSPIEGITKALRLTATGTSASGFMQQFTPLVKGQQYVLSCWIRGTAPKAQLEVYYGTPVRGGLTTVNVTSQWQKVYATCGNTEKFNVPQETKPYSASTVYILPQNANEYIEVCGLKLEKGNRPTDWSPAPEDINSNISEVKQTADKISWLIKSGSSASSLTLTDNTLTAIANNIKLKGNVITSGDIKSTNYISGTSGTKLSLSDGSWDSKNFKIDSNGNVTLSGGTFTNGMISDGGTFVALSKKLINNQKSMARLYGGSLGLFNHDDNGAYGDGGLYLASVEGNGQISTAGNSINFGLLKDNGDSTMPIANIKQYYFTMPERIRIGVTYKDDPYPAFRQLYNANDKLVYAGEIDSKTHLYGKTVGISGTNSITANRSITVSSDARVKNHISDLPSGSENLFDYLSGKSFFYNGDTSAARNYGFIAQDVLSALQKCGLSTNDFAGFCDINGDGSHYALAYEQFIPIMWEEIKRLRKALSERS